MQEAASATPPVNHSTNTLTNKPRHLSKASASVTSDLQHRVGETAGDTVPTGLWDSAEGCEVMDSDEDSDAVEFMEEWEEEEEEERGERGNEREKREEGDGVALPTEGPPFFTLYSMKIKK